MTVAAVLLNLLLAVFSTAQDQGNFNTENRLHLARARLIHKIARVVARRRLPPPFNLIKLVNGILLDAMTEGLPRFLLWLKG